MQTGSAHFANGAYWYNVDRLSFGFSDQESIYLNEADVTCTPYFDGCDNCDACQCENKLSWHLTGGSGGWRAGCTLWLNDDATWRKVVYLLDRPETCPPGSYCPSGLESALPCPVTAFCERNAVSPEPCPRGSYCPTMGMAAPEPCPAGSFCPDEGMWAPAACSPGFHCSTTGLSEQTPCDPGTYAYMQGALPPPIPAIAPAHPLTFCRAGSVECSACRSCGAGHYRARCGGRSAGKCFKCGSCKAGHFRARCGGQSAGTCYRCQSCPAGKYRVKCGDGSSGAGDCVPCRTCSEGKVLEGCGGASRGTCVAAQ